MLGYVKKQIKRINLCLLEIINTKLLVISAFSGSNSTLLLIIKMIDLWWGGGETKKKKLYSSVVFESVETDLVKSLRVVSYSNLSEMLSIADPRNESPNIPLPILHTQEKVFFHDKLDGNKLLEVIRKKLFRWVYTSYIHYVCMIKDQIFHSPIIIIRYTGK